MPSLEVNVARVESRSALWVDRGLLEKLPTLVPIDHYSSVVVVADKGAARATSRIQASLQLSSSSILTIEGGEGQKSVDGLVHIWNFFVDKKIDRKSLIITVGGGATSDLVGFAAATFMRGVAFIHVPTTLLAQVDASIGGKSGINFKGIKNLIGSIAQPCAVIISDPAISRSEWLKRTNPSKVRAKPLTSATRLATQSSHTLSKMARPSHTARRSR